MNKGTISRKERLKTLLPGLTAQQGSPSYFLPAVLLISGNFSAQRGRLQMIESDTWLIKFSYVNLVLLGWDTSSRAAGKLHREKKRSYI